MDYAREINANIIVMTKSTKKGWNRIIGSVTTYVAGKPLVRRTEIVYKARLRNWQNGLRCRKGRYTGILIRCPLREYLYMIDGGIIRTI